ncbi:small multi-drug export protein [Candidatus Saganbacteria bacterium]|nr:small multi-drug export protein [Candidatus Saganbacteria bacterium]
MPSKREFLVLLTAATPILEVRASIPLGLYFGIEATKVFWISVIGSILPILPVLFGLNYLTVHLRKIPAMDRFFEWLFARTRAKGELVQRLETLGLFLFVAVPLPGTGAWTGCAAAYLFGLSYFNGFIACALGTTAAAVMVMAASLGVLRLF